MKLFLLVCIAYLLSFQSFAQEGSNVLVVTKDGMKNIPAYVREGTIYFSLKDFADALGVNYYYNEDVQKIEIKFNKFYVKASAKNPFLVLTEKNSEQQIIIQLPTSTFLINKKVFVPLTYSLSTLQQSYGYELKNEAPNKIIIGGPTPGFIELPDKPSTQFNLNGITLNEKANGTLITLKSNKRIPSYHSAFKDNILTLTFRKVNVDEEKVKYSGGDGVVRKIEAKNVGPDAIISVTVAKEYTTNEVMNIENSNNIQITIHNKLFTQSGSSNKLKDKWEFDVIVIDAGHGGKDAGAIGVNGVKEKDINLSIALKLGKLIEQNMKDVKVVYTRKTDKFVDLYKRGKIANENNGKLFISIHCNSVPKKPSDANGFEVYLLRPGRTKEAISIAEFENSVIKYEENPNRYEKLTDENFILVSMAHSSYMKYSEKFAEYLHKEFSSHPTLSSRGVKQAGFYVLVGASMPSVLIESGFLSNTKDAKHLSTASGQQKFAEFVFNSIKKYRESYELEMQNE
ncbi:MAG: N-acetylmuramoyl-L-alanine amidase [Ignavibacterium sp.]|jgi:N-acetylmuramoyl-L-alanine amidase|nr:N-acetylmuramoyl-L-alanine amidase [Ignavibacterium sp.]